MEDSNEKIKSQSMVLNIMTAVLAAAASAVGGVFIIIALEVTAMDHDVINNLLDQSVVVHLIILLVLLIIVIILAIFVNCIRYQHREHVLMMEKAVDEANSRSRAKSNFLSLMSHEIRTPLNTIMGLSFLAGRNIGDDEKVAECLNKLNSASKYLASLINDILDMASIESEKFTLNETECSLTSLIKNVDYIYRPVINEKGQTLDLEINIENDRVVCDSSRLQQVIMNLLSNATKYTEECGAISIKVEEIEKRSDSSVYGFYVKDNGIGISAENIQRVLAPFEQVRNKRSSYGLQGTGLGLSISRKILEMMNSDICISSTPGYGSVFSFKIVLKHCTELTGGSSDAEYDTEILKNIRVLIADDNEMNLEMLSDLLKTEGIESVMCSNGLEALESFCSSEKGEFDIILMDIQMPEMDGLTAAAEIRRSLHPDAEEIPIVALTAFAFSENAEESREAGMNAHVSKPVNLNEICMVMAQLINSRRGGINNAK